MALSSAVLSSPRQAFDFHFIHMLRCLEKAAGRGAERPGREVSPKEDDAGSPQAVPGSDLQLTLATLAVGCILTALPSHSEGAQCGPGCWGTAAKPLSLSGSQVPPLTSEGTAAAAVSKFCLFVSVFLAAQP